MHHTLAALVLLSALVAVPVSAEITTMQNDSDTIVLPPGSSLGQGSGTPLNPNDTSGFGGAPVDGVGGQGVQNPDDGISELGVFVTGADGSIVVIIGATPRAPGATGGAGGHNTNTLITTITAPDGGLSFSGIDGSGQSGTNAIIASLVGSNGGTITIVGSKLRAALAAKGITVIKVAGWDYDDAFYTDDSAGYLREASLSVQDVAVIASAGVLNDQHIQQVILSGTTLTIQYLTQGWLFGFIPLEMSITIHIDTAAPSTETRVVASYPWYRFFTWLPISPVELAADINAAIVGNNAAGLSNEEAQARLFSQVAGLLKSKAGAEAVTPTGG